MHKGDACAGDYLAPMKDLVRLIARRSSAKSRDKARSKPSHAETQKRGKKDSIDNLHPLVPVDGVEAADRGYSRTVKPAISE